MTAHRLPLRFFDTDLIIETDDPAIVALFARAYARFRVPRPPPAAVRSRVRSAGALLGR